MPPLRHTGLFDSAQNISKIVPVRLKKPKFIYFDLDDTLLDHKKAEKNGLIDVHLHFDEVRKVDINKLIEVYHQINRGLWEEYGAGKIDRKILHRRRFEETFEALGIPTDLYDEAGKVYMNYYRNHWEWVDGAEEAFRQIQQNFETGLITNGFAETQWMKIEQFGFRDKLRHIVISEEVGIMKPNPGIFDHATDLVGVERDQILYIGDSYHSDIRGGKSAGWKVAWFTRESDREKLETADLSFDDFRVLVDQLS
jgi:putative hydrolase of the HAD superfamily